MSEWNKSDYFCSFLIFIVVYIVIFIFNTTHLPSTVSCHLPSTFSCHLPSAFSCHLSSSYWCRILSSFFSERTLAFALFRYTFSDCLLCLYGFNKTHEHDYIFPR